MESDFGFDTYSSIDYHQNYSDWVEDAINAEFESHYDDRNNKKRKRRKTKKSKTLNSGVVKVMPGESPSAVFYDILLRWTGEDVISNNRNAGSSLGLAKIQKAADIYVAKELYYDSMLGVVLEETRACVAEGITTSYNSNRRSVLKFGLSKVDFVFDSSSIQNDSNDDCSSDGFEDEEDWEEIQNKSSKGLVMLECELLSGSRDFARPGYVFQVMLGNEFYQVPDDNYTKDSEGKQIERNIKFLATVAQGFRAFSVGKISRNSNAGNPNSKSTVLVPLWVHYGVYIEHIKPYIRYYMDKSGCITKTFNFNAIPLCNVISHQRMATSCTTCPSTPFFNSILGTFKSKVHTRFDYDDCNWEDGLSDYDDIEIVTSVSNDPIQTEKPLLIDEVTGVIDLSFDDPPKHEVVKLTATNALEPPLVSSVGETRSGAPAPPIPAAAKGSKTSEGNNPVNISLTEDQFIAQLKNFYEILKMAPLKLKMLLLSLNLSQKSAFFDCLNSLVSLHCVSLNQNGYEAFIVDLESAKGDPLWEFIKEKDENLFTQGISTTSAVSMNTGELKVIQGPPGCGKTFFLTILIHSLLCCMKYEPSNQLIYCVRMQGGNISRRKDSYNPRIMICAPSNKAVSVLVDEYLKLIEYEGKDESSGSLRLRKRGESADYTHNITTLKRAVDAILIGVEEKIESLLTTDSESEGNVNNAPTDIAGLSAADATVFASIMKEYIDSSSENVLNLPSCITDSIIWTRISKFARPRSTPDIFGYSYPERASNSIAAMQCVVVACGNILETYGAMGSLTEATPNSGSKGNLKSGTPPVSRVVTYSSSHPSPGLSIRVCERLVHLIARIIDSLFGQYEQWIEKLRRNCSDSCEFLLDNTCSIVEECLNTTSAAAYDCVAKLDPKNPVLSSGIRIIPGGSLNQQKPKFDGMFASSSLRILHESLEKAGKYLGYLMNLFLNTKNQQRFVDEATLSADIIFCTLASAGSSVLKMIPRIDILLVDESGQSLEPELLIPFVYKPNNLILVGDPKQLPPTLISTENVRNGWNVSMMEKLMFKLGYPYRLLNVQYRMHPDISKFPNKSFYNGFIEDSEYVCQRENEYISALLKGEYGTSARETIPLQVLSWLSPYVFIDIHGRELTGYSKWGFGDDVVGSSGVVLSMRNNRYGLTMGILERKHGDKPQNHNNSGKNRWRDVSRSFFNPSEAITVANTVLFISCALSNLKILNNFKVSLPSICVITFYNAQALCIRDTIDEVYRRFNRASPGSTLKSNLVKVLTVDSFQGSECDIVIVSFVRANDRNKIGFVKDFQRLNVALTRAKYMMILVGSASTLSGSGDENLHQLVQDAKQRNILHQIN